MKALDDSAVRLARYEVRGDLRFFVMSNRDVIGASDGGHSTPHRRAARPRRVEVAEIDRAYVHEVATSHRRMFALSCTDRNISSHTHVAHPSGVVTPTHRFFEPHDVEILDASG